MIRSDLNETKFDFNSKYITTGSNYNFKRAMCYLTDYDEWVNNFGEKNYSHLTLNQIVNASQTWIDWIRLK